MEKAWLMSPMKSPHPSALSSALYVSAYGCYTQTVKRGEGSESVGKHGVFALFGCCNWPRRRLENAGTLQTRSRLSI